MAAWLAPEPIPLTLFTEHTDRLPQPLAETAADPLAFVRRARGLGQQRALMDGPRPGSPANARLRGLAAGDARLIGFGWLGERAGTVLSAGKT